LTDIFKENVVIQKPELIPTGKQNQQKRPSRKQAQKSPKRKQTQGSPDPLRKRLNKLLVNVSKLNQEYKLTNSKIKNRKK
ncbi:MAG: hypothetical protein ACYSR9_13485, partial [Planctomycetota bacterium]|jgi:hypothetical protein